MPDNRRSFIKKFGITLGSLIASGSLPGCGAKKDGGLPDTQSQVGKSDKPAPAPRAAEWEQLRQCWLKLNNGRDIENSLSQEIEQARRQGGDLLVVLRGTLAKQHQAILDTLVAKGQLQKPVAEHMQTAFDEAVFHALHPGVMCYEIASMEFTPRQDLFQQAEALRKMSGALDPATVVKAQAAITQDIAFFKVFKTLPEGAEIYGTCPDKAQSLKQDYRAGKLQAGPEELEAARLLTELFLEKPD